MKSEPVKIFWTGGWDSTFRVLQLALVEKKLIQPYYLVDFTRQSYPMELQVINELTIEINKINNLILPIVIYLSDCIPQEDKINEAYLKTKDKCRFGIQLNWMANFCAWKNIYGIEVSSHKHPKPAPYQRIIFNDVENYDYTLNKDSIAYPVAKWFSFPIVGLTKLDMLAYARKHNFVHILEKTWFCFKPVRNKPCGLCHPCKVAIEQGRNIKFARFRNLRKVSRYISNKIKMFR